MRFVVACWMLLLFLAGCQDGPSAPSDLSPDLSGAPTAVVVSGKRVTLATYLSRDFMPISPPDGKPLIGVLRVQTEDGSRVPADVRVDAVWVTHGAELWKPVPREERGRAETAPVYEVVVRDGPKWGPDVTVDVVVNLRDASGRSQLLSARQQSIGATY